MGCREDFWDSRVREEKERQKDPRSVTEREREREEPLLLRQTCRPELFNRRRVLQAGSQEQKSKYRFTAALN